VNYETTWYPANHAAFERVRDGAIGPIRKIVAHAGHFGPKEIGCGPVFLSWLTDPELNGAGALFDFGCYGADLATCLLDGQRPLTVTAVTQQIKPDIYPHVDDEATIVLAYPKAQVIIQASWNWPFDRKDLEIYGQHGSIITVGRDHLRVRLRHDRSEQDVAAQPIPAPDDEPLSYLAGVIGGRIEPRGPSSLATNLIVMEILDAARESAKSGRTIRLTGQ
jgi:glucose-fructose oxidoreductase